MQRECKWGGYKMIDLILELIRKKAGLYVKSIQQEELAVVFPQLLVKKTLSVKIPDQFFGNLTVLQLQ